MRYTLTIIIIMSILLYSCGIKSEKEKQEISEREDGEIDKALKSPTDTIKTEYHEKLADFKKKGIVGQWACNYSGYESVISFIKDGNKFKSEIRFTKSNMATKSEHLKKTGNKYFVQNNEVGEYYLINKDGNLELWDNKGLFTIAQNIMPGIVQKQLPKFDIDRVVGESIFAVRGNYSKSSPETLNGTNNEFWIVYLKDLDVTLRVDKGTDKILKGRRGRVPNMN